MENKKQGGFLNFLFGLIFGILAGYITAALTTEKTGSQLRRDIKLNSSDIITNLKDKFEDFKDQTTVAFREFKGFTDEKLKASAQNIEKQVQSLGEQLEELTKKQAASSHKN
jgi:gas vesicle protein